jgi:hypothetical protein
VDGGGDVGAEDIRVAEWTYRDLYGRLGQGGRPQEAADWLEKVLPSCRASQAYSLCAHDASG